jgi:hypothetical protein
MCAATYPGSSSFSAISPSAFRQRRVDPRQQPVNLFVRPIVQDSSDAVEVGLGQGIGEEVARDGAGIKPGNFRRSNTCV